LGSYAHEAAVDETTEVRGRGSGMHASAPRQFARRQCFARRQRRQHRQSSRVADQRADGREVAAMGLGPGRIFHASILAPPYFDSGQSVWDYPHDSPDGEQMDIVEVMDLSDGLIRHHRVYWGWYSVNMLARGTHPK
jgi:hypothetical protein